jgi:hypothetical protein
MLEFCFPAPASRAQSQPLYAHKDSLIVSTVKYEAPLSIAAAAAVVHALGSAVWVPALVLSLRVKFAKMEAVPALRLVHLQTSLTL